jgi:hypothetical protein
MTRLQPVPRTNPNPVTEPKGEPRLPLVITLIVATVIPLLLPPRSRWRSAVPDAMPTREIGAEPVSVSVRQGCRQTPRRCRRACNPPPRSSKRCPPSIPCGRRSRDPEHRGLLAGSNSGKQQSCRRGLPRIGQGDLLAAMSALLVFQPGNGCVNACFTGCPARAGVSIVEPWHRQSCN